MLAGKARRSPAIWGTSTASHGSDEAPAPLLAFNEAEVVVEVTAPNEDGQFDSSATADSFGGEGGQSDTNPADNEDSETTTVDGEGGGDSDSGTIDPGETLSTVPGTNDNPVTTGDPFAVSLENVGDQTLDGSVSEEECDGSQEGDPLCSVPRVGGVRGDFQFTPAGRRSPPRRRAAARCCRRSRSRGSSTTRRSCRASTASRSSSRRTPRARC